MYALSDFQVTTVTLSKKAKTEESILKSCGYIYHHGTYTPLWGVRNNYSAHLIMITHFPAYVINQPCNSSKSSETSIIFSRSRTDLTIIEHLSAGKTGSVRFLYF